MLCVALTPLACHISDIIWVGRGPLWVFRVAWRNTLRSVGLLGFSTIEFFDVSE